MVLTSVPTHPGVHAHQFTERRSPDQTLHNRTYLVRCNTCNTLRAATDFDKAFGGFRACNSTVKQTAAKFEGLPACTECTSKNTSVHELGFIGAEPYLRPVWTCLRKGCTYKSAFCETKCPNTGRFSPYMPNVVCEQKHIDGQPCGGFVAMLHNNIRYLTHNQGEIKQFEMLETARLSAYCNITHINLNAPVVVPAPSSAGQGVVVRGFVPREDDRTALLEPLLELR